jgi:hypothetical protein
LREAQSINKSLSALGDVISALSSGADFIPYRNNKLTLLMRSASSCLPQPQLLLCRRCRRRRRRLRVRAF